MQRNRVLIVGAQVVFAAAVIGFAAWTLSDQWSAVRGAGPLLAPRWGPIAASCLPVLLAYGILIQTFCFAF